MQPFTALEWFVSEPRPYELSTLPLFYRRILLKISNPSHLYNSLPGLLVKSVSTLDVPVLRISSVRCFTCCHGTKLLICLSFCDSDSPFDGDLVVKANLCESRKSMSWTLVKSISRYLIALTSLPPTYESIGLEIRSSEHIIHLVNPIDLDSVKAFEEQEEVYGQQLETSIVELTHNWRSLFESAHEISQAEDVLARIFHEPVTFGEWLPLGVGSIFSGSRIRLTRYSSEKLLLESLCR